MLLTCFWLIILFFCFALLRAESQVEFAKLEDKATCKFCFSASTSYFADFVHRWITQPFSDFWTTVFHSHFGSKRA